MATRADVVAYSRAQNAIVDAARIALKRVTDRVDPWDIAAMRDALEQVFPSLVAQYGDAAAALAADVFEAQIGANAMLAPAVGESQALASGRWALSPILDGDPVQALANLNLVLDRLVKQPGRYTMMASSYVNDVLYARVPTGTKTCAFCLMLASRGAVYVDRSTAEIVTGRSLGGSDYRAIKYRGRSAESFSRRKGRATRQSMGEKYHDDCNCVAMPFADNHPDLYPEGYDPMTLSVEYFEASKAAGGDTKAILAEMRKQLGIN